MQFGICGSLDNAPAMKAAGWDYVEENVQNLLQGSLADADWQGDSRAKASSLPVLAANVLMPGQLKITGPSADRYKLLDYMNRILPRAKKIGIRTLVFGSAGSRNVPDAFDRAEAKRQIVDFASMSAKIAAEHGVTIVVEPLNRKESNIVNSVAEAMGIVREVNHANFQCLVDSYHLWLENEPLENLENAMPWIHHVHVADKDGRTAPGQSGTSDYVPLLRVLKRGGYDRTISVEAGNFVAAPKSYGEVLEYLKEQWSKA